MTTPDAVAGLLAAAPWLRDPELGVCVVGSAALAEACRRIGYQGPAAADLDLSWSLDVTAGERELRARGVFRDTTVHNRARGTLAMHLAGQRIEITSFRGTPAGAPLRERIEVDAAGRDMTIGAVLWSLHDDRIHDPLGGVEHWQRGRIVACGDPAARIAEHPVRLLRYYRRAAQWSFELDRAIRKATVDPEMLRTIPREAVAAELRAALLFCPSPGRFLLELGERGALQVVAPELAAQFDHRPAGPQRHHPEVSQALHLILALEWLGHRAAGLADGDRLMVAVAVLCHDLGKNLTPAAEWPAHNGHELAGLEVIDALLDSLPGLADAGCRRLAHAVCALHLDLRRFTALRHGTKARLYERWLKGNDFPVAALALAIGADAGGRLGRDAEGDRVRAEVAADVHWLRERCTSIDAGALWQRYSHDPEAFQRALHEARARALRAAPAAD